MEDALFSSDSERQFFFTSAVSGGSFELYIKALAERYGNMARIQLVPLRHRFVLPCHDGQGTPISTEELSQIMEKRTSYNSDFLFCKYIYIEEENTFILFDDEASLAKKSEFACRCGIAAE